MAVPDFQTCILPFLRFLEDGEEHSFRDAEGCLAENFKLSDAERTELLPSWQQGIFKNRIAWARAYLKKACLIEAPKRGVFKITDRGVKILTTNPGRINIQFLEQFPEFVEFRDASKIAVDTVGASVYDRYKHRFSVPSIGFGIKLNGDLSRS